jgi:hypothetical protein
MPKQQKKFTLMLTTEYRDNFNPNDVKHNSDSDDDEIQYYNPNPHWDFHNDACEYCTEKFGTHFPCGHNGGQGLYWTTREIDADELAELCAREDDVMQLPVCGIELKLQARSLPHINMFIEVLHDKS